MGLFLIHLHVNGKAQSDLISPTHHFANTLIKTTEIEKDVSLNFYGKTNFGLTARRVNAVIRTFSKVDLPLMHVLKIMTNMLTPIVSQHYKNKPTCIGNECI